MGILNIALIIVLAVLLLFLFSYLLSQSGEKKELIRRDFLLLDEKIRAEQAKQAARMAGNRAREAITQLANKKKP